MKITASTANVLLVHVFSRKSRTEMHGAILKTSFRLKITISANVLEIRCYVRKVVHTNFQTLAVDHLEPPVSKLKVCINSAFYHLSRGVLYEIVIN